MLVLKIGGLEAKEQRPHHMLAYVSVKDRRLGGERAATQSHEEEEDEEEEVEEEKKEKKKEIKGLLEN